MVGPDYLQPVAPVARDWIDAYDERIRTEFPENPQWWQVFNDPILDELIQETYRQNLTLRVAGMRVLEARYLRRIAAGNVFPQFQEAFGEYARTDVSRNTFPTNRLASAGVPIPNAVNDWATGFDAAWELDVWGKFRRRIEAADANLDASIEKYDAMLVTLIGETARAYIEYRTAQERLNFAEENVAIQQGSLEISEARFRSGDVTKLDVTQATSNLQQTRQTLPLLRTELRLANNRLCILMGIPPQDLASRLQQKNGEQPIPKAPPDVVVGIPANLLRRRPDVREAEREVARQSALIGFVAADLFPHFTIRGAVQVNSQNFSDLFKSTSSASLISPSFQWDLLNYGRLVNKTRVEETRFQQVAIAYQQKVLEANAEVENAIVAFLETQQRVRELELGVAASQEAVELGLARYQGGAIDFNRVFTLQTSLAVQQDRLAEVRGDVAKSLVAIYKALGGGWQIRYGADDDSPPPMEPIPPAAESRRPLEGVAVVADDEPRSRRAGIRTNRSVNTRHPTLRSTITR